MENTHAFTYANRVDVNASVYDILISFYQASPIKDDSGGIIDENRILEANIVMSPQHAKAFVYAMQQQIDWYEGTFGKIDLIGEDSSKDEGQ